MIGLEVTVNGRRLCLAGVGEDGVLTTIVSWVGRPIAGTPSTELSLEVGGLTREEHLTWPSVPELRVGDVVEIRVLEIDAADEPAARRTRSSR